MKRTKIIRLALALALPLVLLCLAACFGSVERPIADFAWCPDGAQGRLDYWFTSTSTTVPQASIDRLLWSSTTTRFQWSRTGTWSIASTRSEPTA